MKVISNTLLRKDKIKELYGDREIQNCPVCNSPVELKRRADGQADRYDPIIVDRHGIFAPVDKQTAYNMCQKRKGKKTVALVGMSPTSCGLAPYKENNVEIWGLNEAHLYGFMPRWDRWFQMHKEDYLLKNETLDGRSGHLPWLQTNHEKPIYTLFKYDWIPSSVEFPLVDVSKELLGTFYRGNTRVKYFTSSFAYMLALAIYEGFERIELYGFDMDLLSQYWLQRACAEFWMGVATGKKIELYIPPRCMLALGILYGYNGTDYTRLPDLTEGQQ
jgi:hypothetical protein